LVGLWLHGLSPHTQRAYRKDFDDFGRWVEKPLHGVGLADMQAYAVHLSTLDLTDGSRHRKMAAIKSVFAFGHRLGYLPFDVARPLRLPSSKDTLCERILDEDQVRRLLRVVEDRPRDRVMLTLLYASGVRVSELASLRWSDVRPRLDACQITVLGKGGRTRTILLPRRTWADLLSIRGDADEERPLFPSRKGGHLSPSQILRIVKSAAQQAGLTLTVSPHWLRHSHASHALDRGAPIHLVQATLGHRSVATTGRYLHARPSDGSSRFLDL
jgi:integrase/recombinase XerD